MPDVSAPMKDGANDHADLDNVGRCEYRAWVHEWAHEWWLLPPDDPISPDMVTRRCVLGKVHPDSRCLIELADGSQLEIP